ncbi:lipoate--protein ligase family protein [bacterium]|nr:lipoate--protein ligase family protein [bacterium]
MVLRLVDSGLCSGAFNMAMDESLHFSFEPGRDDVTVRLYSWERPCISLGYFQRTSDAIRLSTCQERGVEVVRRPTGGRAVLHHNELTYSVISGVGTGPFSGSLLECYRAISACLIAGCERLGIPADKIEMAAGRDTRGASNSPACFMISSAYEIMVDGRKLIGSAQKRGQSVFMQHGSIPLRLDLQLMLDTIAGHDGLEEERVLDGFGPTSLNEVLGRAVCYDEAASAIAEGFVSQLGLDAERGEPDCTEKELAEDLMRKKYSSDSWNFRR